MHPTLQGKIIVPEGALHHLMWSLMRADGETDINKMEADVVQQLAVVMQKTKIEG